MNWTIFFTMFFGVLGGLAVILGLVYLCEKLSRFIGDWLALALILTAIIVGMSALVGWMA